jgi:signal transduction histidine kinase
MEKLKRAKKIYTSDKLNTILHDLANPLTVVQLNLDLLHSNSDYFDNPELQKILDRALAGLDHANRIVINTKMQLQRQEPISAFSAVEELEKLCRVYVSLIQKQNIILEQDFQDDKMFAANLAAFQRIISNILVNAIESFSGKPSGQKFIKLTTERSVTDFTITICDTGSGMDAATLQKIYLGFSTKTTGRGIGLQIVLANLEEYFQGRLDVKSERGAGSSFCIIIPNKQSQSEKSNRLRF